MVAAIINFVKARMELLKMSMQTVMSLESERYKRLSQDAVGCILKTISSVGQINCETVTAILKLLKDDVEGPITQLFTEGQVETIRERLADKLDQHMGASNASNTKYQNIAKPELWLTKDLQDIMLADAQSLNMQQKISFRINALACFFGRVVLGVPAELTSRDIAVLALLDVDDATCMTDGLYWVRQFKLLVKPIAKSNIEALVALPTMLTPESHSKDAPPVVRTHVRREGGRAK